VRALLRIDLVALEEEVALIDADLRRAADNALASPTRTDEEREEEEREEQREEHREEEREDEREKDNEEEKKEEVEEEKEKAGGEDRPEEPARKAFEDAVEDESASTATSAAAALEQDEVWCPPVAQPPDGVSWEWPLSRQERKARIHFIDQQMLIADNADLLQRLEKLYHDNEAVREACVAVQGAGRPSCLRHREPVPRY